MKITFLGTGSIIPNPKHDKIRSYSAILIEIKNEKLLFDIGPGTLTKMQNLGINTQIFPDKLFITHYHIDHCLDYAALVKSRYFDQKNSHVAKGKILNVFGPPGLKKWNNEIFSSVSKWRYMSKELNYRHITKCLEVKKGIVTIGRNWKVTCCPVDHDNGIAFRIDANHKSFVYSGDMAYDENLSELGKKADLVAIECSFPDKKTLSGKHLEPTLIGKLAQKGKFKHVILTHMYPIIYGKEKQISKVIQKMADCKVSFSYDFKEIIL